MFFTGLLFSSSLLVLVFQSFSLWNYALSSPKVFVRISDANLVFTSGNVLHVMTSPSVIECGMECQKKANCTSYNARPEESNRVSCNLLSNIPLSPVQDLTVDSGGEYFEKTCQLFLNPSVATEYDEDGAIVPNSIFLGFDDGKSIYILEMSGSHDVIGVTYHESQANQLAVSNLLGMAKLRPRNGTVILVYLTDGGLVCYKKTQTSSQPCFSEMPVSVNAIFGTDDVIALLPTKTHTGLMAFGYSRITIMDVPISGNWTVNTVIDLSPGNQTTNIPRGVVGAAWIVPQSMFGENIFSTAFLMTKHYYIVYDVDTDKVLKRGHLCPNHLITVG